MRPSRHTTGPRSWLLGCLAWRGSTPLAPGRRRASIHLPGGSPRPRVAEARDATPAKARAPRAARVRRTAAGGRRADFDFYLLSLTLEPAFCDDGNQRIAQCRALDVGRSSARRWCCTGLWPEAREPGRYPRDCPGPRLDPCSRRRAPTSAAGCPASAKASSATSGAPTAPARGSTTTLFPRGDRRHPPRQRGARRRDPRQCRRSVDAATLRRAAERLRPGFGSRLVFVCRTLRSEDPQSAAAPARGAAVRRRRWTRRWTGSPAALRRRRSSRPGLRRIVGDRRGLVAAPRRRGP